MKSLQLLHTILQLPPSCLSYQSSKQHSFFPSFLPHLLIILCLGRGQNYTLFLQEEEKTSKARGSSSGKQVSAPSAFTQNCNCFLFPQSQSLRQQQQHLPPCYQTLTVYLQDSCVLCLWFKPTLNKPSEKKHNTQGGLIKDLYKRILLQATLIMCIC